MYPSIRIHIDSINIYFLLINKIITNNKQEIIFIYYRRVIIIIRHSGTRIIINNNFINHQPINKILVVYLKMFIRLLN